MRAGARGIASAVALPGTPEGAVTSHQIHDSRGALCLSIASLQTVVARRAETLTKAEAGFQVPTPRPGQPEMVRARETVGTEEHLLRELLDLAAGRYALFEKCFNTRKTPEADGRAPKEGLVNDPGDLYCYVSKLLGRGLSCSGIFCVLFYLQVLLARRSRQTGLWLKPASTP